MKRIAIVGGGAIGLLYSAYLGGEFKVILYTRTQEQAQFINENGVVLTQNDQQKCVRVTGQQLKEPIEEVDLIIVAVKQYHLQEVLHYLQLTPQSTPILFIQNGMKHLSIIDSLFHEHLLIGVVEHGALKVGANAVVHTGVGMTRIGIYKGIHEQANSLLHRINQPSFVFTLEEDWQEIVIRKLVVNAIINPLTALYRVKNGELIKNPAFFHTMTQLFNEVKQGLALKNEEVYWQGVLTICRKTADNHSSMLKDVMGRNSTEIDAILGYILEEASRKKIEMPLTNFLYHSIKGIENKERGEL
ncbi:2-dehydropantoate 2-reductase [Bacillus sp. CGMCC 1.16541]|uniref:2-dehydropantoate 2-reductase n=1 Tax=Bacillus sp. CGMCC 1.16541 TaxID=2185143 RepID=UPI0013A58885|nr:2-dehydropantoate 2-reductase [Bacillus sp. CGMCC 1.16541]